MRALATTLKLFLGATIVRCPDLTRSDFRQWLDVSVPGCNAPVLVVGHFEAIATAWHMARYLARHRT